MNGLAIDFREVFDKGLAAARALMDEFKRVLALPPGEFERAFNAFGRAEWHVTKPDTHAVSWDTETGRQMDEIDRIIEEFG